VSGGVPSYSYSWFRDGVQVGTNSSYSECFSYNGTSGGSYQFTLRIDVRDAQNSLASASKTVTAYNSSGGGIESIEEIFAEPLPTEFSISQNYPNPFNPETEITFGIPEPSRLRITIMDVLGRELRILREGQVSPGYHRVRWSGQTANGGEFESGIYFCRISAKGESGKEFDRVLKMILLK
jgi:hypothetical protein